MGSHLHARVRQRGDLVSPYHHMVQHHPANALGGRALVLPAIKPYLVGNGAPAAGTRGDPPVNDILHAARRALVSLERAEPEGGLEACCYETLAVIHIDVLVGDVAEVGSVYAADGEGCTLVQGLVVVGVVIAEEHAAVHKAYVLVQAAMVLGPDAHGAVAVVPQLHAAEGEVTRGRALGRLSGIEPLDGNGIIVGTDKGVEEGTLLAVDDIQPIGGSIARGKYLNALELHILAMIDHHLPHPWPVGMEEHALHIRPLALVGLKEHTGIGHVVVDHATPAHRRALVRAPQAYASIDHSPSRYIRFPAILEHEHVLTCEYLTQVMESRAKVMQARLLVTLVSLNAWQRGGFLVHAVAEQMQGILARLSIDDQRDVLVGPCRPNLNGAAAFALYRDKVQLVNGKHLLTLQRLCVGDAYGDLVAILKLETTKLHQSAPVAAVIVKPHPAAIDRHMEV